MAPTNADANAGADSSSSTGSGGNGSNSSSSTLKKGPWTAAEDAILMEYVKKHGEGNWNAVQKNSGLSRCGKSCRLRWANHLRPNLKKGSFSPEEERLILELHAKLGNKWARMAAQLPGRTDNEIKNYWNTRIKRRQRAGLPLYPPEIQRQAAFTHHRHSSSPSPNSSSSALSLSPSPSPPLPIPSLPLQKSHFHGPLPPFDPMSFSAPLLSCHHHHQFLPQPPLNHRFKQFPDNAVASSPMFPLPFSSPLPSSSPPLFPQNLHPHQFPPPLQQQSYQFSAADFDLNPPILQPPTFESNGLLPAASISMKMELPSSQVPGLAATPTPESLHDDYKNAMACSASLARSNSGLLDALLQEAQEMAESNDLHKEALHQGPSGGLQGMDGCVDDCNQSRTFFHEGGATSLGSTGQWDDSSSAQSPIGITMKEDEPMDKINSDDEDLCNLLDIIPASMPTVSEWYSDSGEVSNGQSGVTDEEIGLGAQPPASTFTMATDHDWTEKNVIWDFRSKDTKAGKSILE
ncbi:hypothetical protein ACLOJK_029742 [Asimina triloba]